MTPATQGLRLESVGLEYRSRSGNILALDDVNLHVQKGSFISILGPSGCGKSTLLRLVLNLEKPTKGSIILHGRPMAAQKHEVGVVFQRPALLPWQTVLENVLIPARILSLPVETSRQRAAELLQMVGLGDFMNKYPWELSGGMQQRAGIARSLISDPGFLMMDEPFAALDAMTREHMMAELQKIWMDTGKSVLFVTHSIAEAVFLSDKVVVLSPRPGRVIHELDINLPRPRQLSDISTPAFGELSKELRNQLGAVVS